MISDWILGTVLISDWSSGTIVISDWSFGTLTHARANLLDFYTGGESSEPALSTPIPRCSDVNQRAASSA